MTNAAKETLSIGQGNRHLLAILLLGLSTGFVAIGGYYFRSYIPFLQRVIPEQALIVPASAERVAVRESEVEPFADWIAKPHMSYEEAVNQALLVWKKQLPEHVSRSCHTLAGIELRCLFEQGNLDDILALNRPAILEFPVNATESHHALLVGVDKEQAIIRASKNFRFPLADVLKSWNGHFLILWQPPMPGALAIAPPLQSDSVIWLRKQLAAINGSAVTETLSPVFDKELTALLIDFQRRNRLVADGVAGARTLIQIENQTGIRHSPQLKVIR